MPVVDQRSRSTLACDVLVVGGGAAGVAAAVTAARQGLIRLPKKPWRIAKDVCRTFPDGERACNRGAFSGKSGHRFSERKCDQHEHLAQCNLFLPHALR
jgi:FAD binding domain